MKKISIKILFLLLLSIFIACITENLDKVEMPTFSLGSGSYVSTRIVTISCTTPDATIYYTTNGQDPTTSSNEKYVEPIRIGNNTTLKAFALKNGMSNSDVAIADYTILWNETSKSVSDASVEDLFGASVAISGDGTTIVSGAYGSNDLKGCAYVFKKNSTTSEWEEKQKLEASNGSDWDWYGYSATISYNGEIIVIGAHYVDKAYAYKYNSTTLEWEEKAILTASDDTSLIRFGRCVGISNDGTVIAVGADGVSVGDDPKDPGYLSAVGAVYVYRWNVSSWIEESKLMVNLPYEPSGGDTLGYNLAISGNGNTIIAGASGYTSEFCEQLGAAYIFEYSGSTWSQTRILPPSQYQDDYDQFGYSVAVSGDGKRVAIGSYWDDNVGEDSGSIYIYDLTGTSWPITPSKIISASDGGSNTQLGYWTVLSEDGSMVVSSANKNGGKMYIYKKDGTQWVETIIIPSDIEEGDGFGHCVSISDDNKTITAGSFRHDLTSGNDDAGIIYIYTYNE